MTSRPEPPVGGCFGFARVRITLLSINLVMILLAIPVFLLSLMVLLRHDDQVKEGYLIKKNYATYASVLLASCSIVMIMAGIIGQASIWTNFTKGTVLYMWVSLSFIAIQLLVIGCIFVWKDHLYQMIKLDLDQSLEFYRDMPIVRDHWDHLQESLHCCGDEGPHTWQKVFFADDVTKVESQIGVAPASCASLADMKPIVVHTCPGIYDKDFKPINESSPERKTDLSSDLTPTNCVNLTLDLVVFEKGCVEAVTEYLEGHINLIAYVGLAYLLSEMVAAFLAFRLRHLAEKVGIID
ncbi:leukocyte antigen CD37-like [Symsagittifera roscoffensis]|uniref:leukocyte antigen CD37-like n=1 Tax=Symsagittifera roscoffensis TaxID=84072 RepID=UPI00307CA27B